MTAPQTQRPAGAAPADKISAALLRYRVMAWVVGVWLILLCLEMVLKYWVEVDWPIAWIPPAHGFFYFVYVLVTFDLAIKVRWPLGKTVGILLAGTIPLLGIVVEHFQTRNVTTQFGL
jgi:integral membrane protein